MDQVVAQVAERIGVSPEKARMAVETVVTFLKQKLPPPMAAQIEHVLESKESGGDLGGFGLADGLGGMLDK